jgi:hypothetical protein
MMRTTLTLPDDVHSVINSLAEAKGISLSEAVAQLMRKGLRPDAVARDEGGFPCFAVPEGAAPITLAQTLAAEHVSR